MVFVKKSEYHSLVILLRIKFGPVMALIKKFYITN